MIMYRIVKARAVSCDSKDASELTIDYQVLFENHFSQHAMKVMSDSSEGWWSLSFACSMGKISLMTKSW